MVVPEPPPPSRRALTQREEDVSASETSEIGGVRLAIEGGVREFCVPTALRCCSNCEGFARSNDCVGFCEVDRGRASRTLKCAVWCLALQVQLRRRWLLPWSIRRV